MASIENPPPIGKYPSLSFCKKTVTNTKDFRALYKNKQEKKRENPPQENLSPPPSFLWKELHRQVFVEKPESPPSIVNILQNKLVVALQQESKKGISETVIHIQGEEGFSMKGGQFLIRHYDTHPHSFQIQFLGTEQGLNSFAQHKRALQEALQKMMPTFIIDFLSPEILQDFTLLQSQRMVVATTEEFKMKHKSKKIAKVSDPG